MTIDQYCAVVDDDEFKPIEHIVFGTIAGAAGKIAEYPLDTLMVRLQAQDLGGNETKKHFNGAIDCVKKSFKEGGVVGLYRGVMMPLTACMIDTSLAFLTYNYAQTKLIEMNRQADNTKHIGNGPTYDLSVAEMCVCGAASGIPVTFIITPFELLKCRIQVLSGQLPANSLISKKQSSIDMLRAALKADGPLSLYRGITGTFVREVAGGAVWFGVYEALSRKIVKFRNTEKNATKDSLLFPELFASGAVAGIACSLFTSPPDVIKCIQQTYLRPISSYQVTKDLLKFEGFKGLYRGIGVSLIRTSFSSGFTLALYDTLRINFKLF